VVYHSMLFDRRYRGGHLSNGSHGRYHASGVVLAECIKVGPRTRPSTAMALRTHAPTNSRAMIFVLIYCLVFVLVSIIEVNIFSKVSSLFLLFFSLEI